MISRPHLSLTVSAFRILAIGSLIAACQAAAVAPRTSSGECPLTLPNGSTPPGERPSPFHYGNGAIWTALWPDGIVRADQDYIDASGAIAMKWPWWRASGAVGSLNIDGQRIDGGAPPLGVVIAEGYGDRGFQATTLIFPTEGCWEITARAGRGQLSLVTEVVLASSAP